MKNDRRDVALSYAKRGWQIFPATRSKTGYSIEKRGIDVGTPWGRTSDPEVIRTYWKRIPNANIGLAMGAISGVWDLEFDTPEGHDVDGAASLAKLEKKFGPLPATLMFTSPSGSTHRLFKHPGDTVRIRSGALDAKNYPGVDIRGDGAMAVVPPSRTRKGVYTWRNKRRIATAPAWLVAMVCKPARAPRESTGEPQADLASLTLAMAMIPNPDCDWESWNRVGMALFNARRAAVLKVFACSVRGRIARASTTLARRHRSGRRLMAVRRTRSAPERSSTWPTRPCRDGRGRMYYDAEVIALIEEFRELLGEPADCDSEDAS